MSNLTTNNFSQSPNQNLTTQTIDFVDSQPGANVHVQTDPELIKVFLEHSSPILLLLVLCWFFKILTKFIEVCQQD